MAAGHLGEQVGGGRRDDQQVGLARQADVADLLLVVEVEQVGEHALRRSARRPTAASRTRVAARVMTARTEAPASRRRRIEVEALVGGDAAADDEQNTLLFHVGRSKSLAAGRLA